MNRREAWRAGALVGLLLGVQADAKAGNVIAAQEYDKYIDKHRTVQALDSSLFGEQISARDGSVFFKVTDAELPGDGPPMRITRTFKPRENNRFIDTSGTEIAGWMFEIPRIKTIVNNLSIVTGNSPYLWQVPAADKNARCSQLRAPGDLTFGDVTRYWQDHEWWSGYQLVDGDGNEQQILVVSPSYTELAGYEAVTNGNWRISCLTAIQNGVGEGFLATSPEGTRYWFDYLIYTTADSMTKPAGGTPQGATAPTGARSSSNKIEPPTTDAIANDYLQRKHAAMLVTRVEDRFGNSLVYSYQGNTLTKIKASDGRFLEVSGSSPVTIKLGHEDPVTGAKTFQTWTYEYLTGGVGKVTLPQLITSPATPPVQWTYNFAPLTSLNISAAQAGGSGCGLATGTLSGSAQATAVSPSGVTGTFSFTLKRFGRSYVPYSCFDPWGDGSGHLDYPPNWTAFALSSRSFAGPGITTQTWTYAYSPANASFSNSCASGCVAEVWTDVTDPRGTRQRSVFSNRWGETENQLLREETYTSSNVLLRRVTHQYATHNFYPAGTVFPWPEGIGDDMQLRTNKARSERWAPASRNQTEQQGRLFTWQVPSTCGPNGTTPCFDRFARPTKVVKSSATQ